MRFRNFFLFLSNYFVKFKTSVKCGLNKNKEVVNKKIMQSTKDKMYAF